MHYKEITGKALEKGWLVTSGKTPEASMYAQVITEIKRQQKRGERPRFVQHGRGYIGLSQWMGRGHAFQIEQHNHQVRKALRERLLAMKPGEFEELISQLLAEMGFEMVEVTKLSGDGGIDVRGTLVVGDVVRIKMAVPVKKWKLKNNILAPVVQQVRGSLVAHEQGLIITTSDFSAGAIKEAAQPDKTPIALMNGLSLRQARLFALMMRLERLPAGTRLVQEGDYAGDMYVVIDGELDIWVEREGQHKQ
ncbi:restriction endonuclease, partial [Stenotrophomonas sp.]|uniref:restriction endonuclease n=1 Tax=Stenotrophomonas sp. TaxID=69392 RepID=UPI0025DC70E0